MTTATAIEHHPIFRDYRSRTSVQAPAFMADFLGIQTRVAFMAGMLKEYRAPEGTLSVTPGLPIFDEEYFEWVDVLEAVQQAGDEFVMVELGAGFGRWLMRGAAAARQRARACRFVGIGVEAEPEHFRWMEQHFLDNGLDLDELDLTWAAVGATPGFLPFWVGDPSGWYGQAVAHQTEEPFPDVRARRDLKARSVLGHPPVVAATGQSRIWVPCTTLADVIAPYQRIDLIDLDIQGLEFEVLAAAIDVLDAKVRRIHIGTHSAEVEEDLRRLFGPRGWKKVNDYACQQRQDTPYGEILFGDGVQTWINPLVG